MANESYKTQVAKAAEQLRDPFRFRMFVALIVLAIGYFAIYTPLADRIAGRKRVLKQEEDRDALFQEVGMLRAQRDLVENRLVKDTDANEWIQYVLNGVRRLPLTLINLDSNSERRVGIYRAVAMRLEVSGEMRDLDSLLHWLETNERLFRIETVNVAAHRTEDTRRVMQLTILGLKG
jgi:hypothetical protein